MLFEYEPAGQNVHVLAVPEVEFPAPHEMHCVAPAAAEYMPEPHGRHCVACVARLAYVPALHCVQLAALFDPLTDPTGHAWQLTFPMAVKNPGVHAVHIVALFALYDPTGHVAHVVLALNAYVPALHIVHADALPMLYPPSGQLTHCDIPDDPLYSPARHPWQLDAPLVALT